MKFSKLLKYDMANGIFRKGYFYVIALALGLLFSVNFYINVVDSVDCQDVTYANILFFLFCGKEPFNPDIETAFVFPVIWLLIFLYAAFITLDYPYRDLMENGIQVLIRVNNRKDWWLSKCVWVCLSTLLYFGLIYLGVLVACCLLNINISMSYAFWINENILNMQLVSLELEEVIMLLFVLPVMTSLTVNYIQLFLSLLLDRVYSFLFSAVLLFASTYFLFPMAIGNYSMIKRSIYCNVDGVTIGEGIIVNAILIIVTIVVGGIGIKKMDIMKKND